MSANKLLDTCKEQMAQRVSAFEKDLTKVRTGRASASVLDKVRVEYYGTPTPLNQIATVSTPDAKTIMISPFEKSLIAEIERGIFKADLGLAPTNDGQVVRVHVPPLTEDRRKEIVKGLKKTAEEAKVSLRMFRRDSNEALKKMEKDKVISEDDNKRHQTTIQKMTDDFVTKIDDKLAVKEKEILNV